jgi:hypothetical protein
MAALLFLQYGLSKYFGFPANPPANATPRLIGYRDAVVIRHGPKESCQQVSDEVSRGGGDTDHEATESRLRGSRRGSAEVREKPNESAPEGTGEHGHPGEAGKLGYG